jgi:hypothetical protein
MMATPVKITKCDGKGSLAGAIQRAQHRIEAAAEAYSSQDAYENWAVEHMTSTLEGLARTLCVGDKSWLAARNAA